MMQLIDKKEAAALLNVSPFSMNRLMRELPYVRVGARRVMFDPATCKPTLKPGRCSPSPGGETGNSGGMTPELIQAGRNYVQAGLTIIPVNARKKPAIEEWTSFENGRRTSLKDIEQWSKLNYVHGWAVICGPPSDNVCILDFDVPVFFERWTALVGDLAEKLPIQQTGSGDGRQVAFKSSLNLRNDKLAYSPADNKEGREIAIETRGAGGYAVLPLSFCPQAKKRGIPHKQAYKTIQGDFTQIPTISPEEAQRLIEAARSLCQAPLSLSQMKVAPIPPRNYGNNGNGGVIDKFNELNEVGSILARNGYEMRGPRYLAPDSTTGEPGVYIFEDTGRCYLSPRQRSAK